MQVVTSDSQIKQILQNHPRVEIIAGDHPGILFKTNRDRFVMPATNPSELNGLVELMDNNPLVCADEASVPSPGGTLALIALGPLIEAGLVSESPAVILSFPEEESSILHALRSVQWHGEITLQCENHDLGSLRGAYVLVKLKNIEDWNDIDAIYDERYGRSFMIRRVEDNDFKPQEIVGNPWACYYMELSEGETESILAIHAMADINGKLGAAQCVHMMNVMCGFEESLGLI